MKDKQMFWRQGTTKRRMRMDGIKPTLDRYIFLLKKKWQPTLFAFCLTLGHKSITIFHTPSVPVLSMPSMPSINDKLFDTIGGSGSNGDDDEDKHYNPQDEATEHKEEEEGLFLQ